MARKWGKCDYKQLQNLQKKMEKLAQHDFDKFCQDAAKELAARLLALVIPRTPVGVYPRSAGKNGGTLRRGWTAATEAEAESGSEKKAAEYAKSLPVKKAGTAYQIEIINPVHYASYVEYGHRTRGHKGFVKGRHMLTISEQQLQAMAPSLLDKKLEKYLRECFNGQ